VTKDEYEDAAGGPFETAGDAVVTGGGEGAAGERMLGCCFLIHSGPKCIVVAIVSGYVCVVAEKF
jgi:hypothetical protein